MKEELIELRTRVGDINRTVGEMKALMAQRETRAADLYSKVDKIYDCLIGDGNMDKPSVIVRLDRVEQIMLLVKWVCAVVVGLLINAIFGWIKHS